MSKNWKIDFKSSLQSIDTPTLNDTFDTYLWSIEITSIVLCIVLFVFSANRISKNQYTAGLMTFMGGILAGISPYLANVFLL